MTSAKRRIAMPEHWRAWFRRVADGELPDLPGLAEDASDEDRMWFAIAADVFVIVFRSDATLAWNGTKDLARKKPGPTWKAEAKNATSAARTLCDVIAHNPGAAQVARTFIFLALKAGGALVQMEFAFGAGDENAGMASYFARRKGGRAKSAKTREKNQPTHTAIIGAMRDQRAMKPQPSRTKAAQHVAETIPNPRTGKPYSPRRVFTISQTAIPVWWRTSP
jgi:hypothetical protein